MQEKNRFFIVLFALNFIVKTAHGALPLARHVIVTGASETDIVIALNPYDADGHSMNTTIKTLPSVGTLYQLSEVYSRYGYDPKRAAEVSSTDTEVEYLSGNRILYAAPLGFSSTSFQYNTVDQDGTSTNNGIVYITSSDKVMVKSTFIQSAESWTIETRGSIAASFSATSVGSLNHFIYSDDIPLVLNQKNDVRWSFKAPSKFQGAFGMAYNGYLQFYMTSFAGDFSTSALQYSNPKTFVSIACSSCNSGNGITLAQRSIAYTGGTQFFNFTLNEEMINGWKKDTKDRTLNEWYTPTACEVFEVLSGISSINIYGDFTSEYESIAIDEVKLILGDGDVAVECYP